MSQQTNDKIARSLLDSSGREVSWPMVFAGVKNVARTNNLNLDTLTCIKGWLKSNDSQLHVPLIGVTVLHTLSLNCSTVVRNQMASPKLFQRLEKQLARPQGPQVATALVQLLSDWIYLFGQEELGARSQALLDQTRFRQIAMGCTPSTAVLELHEDMTLGLPPVAPIRGEDFIKWMYRSASINDRTPSIHASTSAGSVGGSSNQWPSVRSGALPGGAPSRITTQGVPELSKRMRADAERMTSALTACRTAARVQHQTELRAVMDAAYREAERCSQWRRRAQEYTQICDDSEGLADVLSATDEINRVLRAWQQFTSVEMFDLLRITVPPRPLARAQPHPQQQQEQARTNPFTSGPEFPQSLALMATAPQKAAVVPDLLIDDLGPSLPPPPPPPLPPLQQQQPALATAQVMSTPSMAGMASRPSASSLSSPPPFADISEAAFSQERGAPSWAGGAKPLQAGSQPSLQRRGGLVSPSADSAVSTRSAPSTPNGTAAAPSSSSSYVQPFYDLWAAATAPHSRIGVGVAGPYPVGPTPGALSSAAAADRNTTGGRNGSCSNGQASSAHVLEWQPEFDRLASDLRALLVASGLGSPMPSPSGTSIAGRASGTHPGRERLLPDILSRVRGMCEALSAKHERQMVAAVAGARPSTLPFSASTDEALGRNVAGSHSHMQLRAVASTSPITSTGGAATVAAGEPHGVVGNRPAAALATAAATGSWVGFGADDRVAQSTSTNQPALQNQQPPPHLQRPNGTSLAVSGKSYDDSLI